MCKKCGHVSRECLKKRVRIIESEMSLGPELSSENDNVQE